MQHVICSRTELLPWICYPGCGGRAEDHRTQSRACPVQTGQTEDEGSRVGPGPCSVLADWGATGEGAAISRLRCGVVLSTIIADRPGQPQLHKKCIKFGIQQRQEQGGLVHGAPPLPDPGSSGTKVCTG